MSPKKCCKKELNSARLYLKISLVLVQREKDHPVCFSPCFVKDAICLAAGRKKKLVKCTCFFFAAQRSRFKIVHHTTIRGKSRGAPEKEPYCESQFLPSIIICQCLLNLNNDS